MAAIPLRWTPRMHPLSPVGLAAPGEAARALLGRLRRSPPEELAGLEGAGARGLLVLLGKTSLPWVRGAVYLGVDAGARTLLLPTTLEPGVPVGLLEQAVAARAKGRVALLPEPPMLVQLESPSPLDPAALDALQALVLS
jgi:hypothetical protein